MRLAACGSKDVSGGCPMSEPRVAAIVCEGQTDVPILRAALQEVWPGLDDIRCLQPELDESDRAKGPAGWSLVKA